MRVRRARAREEFEGAALEVQGGRARLFGDDFYVVPAEAARPAGAQGFEGGLLGGEARGVMLRRNFRAVAVAVFALALGENALAEARRAREDFTHAPDFDNVYADGNDH